MFFSELSFLQINVNYIVSIFHTLQLNISSEFRRIGPCFISSLRNSITPIPNGVMCLSGLQYTRLSFRIPLHAVSTLLVAA